jgi:hypothetical protein
MLLFWKVLKREFITPDRDFILMAMVKKPYAARVL